MRERRKAESQGLDPENQKHSASCFYGVNRSKRREQVGGTKGNGGCDRFQMKRGPAHAFLQIILLRCVIIPASIMCLHPAIRRLSCGSMFSSLRQSLTSLITTAHLKLGVRACVAALVAHGLATLIELPHGYWAVLTAVLVVQSTVGASLSIAVERTLGTLVGGVVGVAGALLAGPSQNMTFLMLTIGILLTSTLAARSAAFKLAPVTVVIVLLADPSHAMPMVSALFRLMEIGLGGIVGVLSALLIMPARALFFLFPNCAEAVRHCSTLLVMGRDGLLGRSFEPARVDGLSARIRTALRAADTRAREARAERRWSAHADPAPVVRSCRRLWHSVIILLRSAGHPLPAPMAEKIGPDLDEAICALCAYIEMLARRLEGQEADEQVAITAGLSVAALEARAERLNAEGVLDHATGADLTALFAAISACTHVHINLDELATRLTDLSVQERG